MHQKETSIQCVPEHKHEEDIEAGEPLAGMAMHTVEKATFNVAKP